MGGPSPKNQSPGDNFIDTPNFNDIAQQARRFAATEFDPQFFEVDDSFGALLVSLRASFVASASINLKLFPFGLQSTNNSANEVKINGGYVFHGERGAHQVSDATITIGHSNFNYVLLRYDRQGVAEILTQSRPEIPRRDNNEYFVLLHTFTRDGSGNIVHHRFNHPLDVNIPGEWG